MNYDNAIKQLTTKLHLTTDESASIAAQALKVAYQQVPYTRLLQDMESAVQDRRSEVSTKAADARQDHVLAEIAADEAVLSSLSQTFANPMKLVAGSISPWLAKRFSAQWELTPTGHYAKQALDKAHGEITLNALESLDQKRSKPQYEFVTLALREAGFKLLPRQEGQEVAQFVADGLEIDLRLGRLENSGHLSVDPKSLTIEKIGTHKESKRIAGLRFTLETLFDATDQLGMHLHIKPQAIDLGPKLKPLHGAALISLYKNYGFNIDDELLRREPRSQLDIHRLLDLSSTPTSDQELEEIAQRYKQALQASYDDSGFKMHHLFDEPAEVVRTEAAVKEFVASNGWLSPEQAQSRIAQWKEHAQAQSKTGVNSDKVVISLFDLSGEWSKPWRDAGYDVYQFDIQAGDGVEQLGINVGDVTNFSSEFFSDIFASFDGKHVHAVLAANPCTDFASSGARHFEGKDADGTTSSSVDLVKMSLAVIEYFKPSVWAIENPTGRIERLGGLPQWSASFDPYHFGEDYTKRTMLWGRMNGHMPIAPCEPTEGSKMHQLYGGKSLATKNARSVTPEGFAYAFFLANNAADNPVISISGKYDRLDRSLIEKAVSSGMQEHEIDKLVQDYYYFEIDDAAAELALSKAMGIDGITPKKQSVQQSLFGELDAHNTQHVTQEKITTEIAR